MRAGEMLDEALAGILQHKHLTGRPWRPVRPYDADHFGVALVLPHMIEQRLLAGGERQPGCNVGALAGGS